MKTKKIALSTEKMNGRFFTPAFIVNNILDLSGYKGQNILKKHAIDNSCGDGAFLVYIVSRYCEEYLKNSNDLEELALDLSEYIHGIEMDKVVCQQCIDNLNFIVKSFGINGVNWDICCGSALSINKYDGKMDFVLGNPPYIRVHNLGINFNDVKKFIFAQKGMTDLYIVFYEIGIRMLNNNGTLGYITPSSYFNSIAGKYMRSYFVDNNLLDKIVDLKHSQVFSSTTYTAITILKKNRKIKTCDYYRFESENSSLYYVGKLCCEDYYICDNFYFADKEKLEELKNILMFKSNEEKFVVKNGFATLADKFFIGEFDFDEFTIPVIKAATGKKYRCLFPYNENKLIPYKTLTSNSKVKDYFENNKETLLNRSLEKKEDWYGFGRTQGIGDVYKVKYSINTLIRDVCDLKIIKCDKGVGVYSGLYILTDIDENELLKILYNKDFISYISLLGKYKSGGYYTFSSKDLKNYLEYKYSQREAIGNG